MGKPPRFNKFLFSCFFQLPDTLLCKKRREACSTSEDLQEKKKSLPSLVTCRLIKNNWCAKIKKKKKRGKKDKHFIITLVRDSSVSVKWDSWKRDLLDTQEGGRGERRKKRRERTRISSQFIGKNHVLHSYFIRIFLDERKNFSKHSVGSIVFQNVKHPTIHREAWSKSLRSHERKKKYDRRIVWEFYW